MSARGAYRPRRDSLDFRTREPQVWWDGWRNAERTCLYAGQCVICGRRTYAFTDGENDPRGVLGDHAASPLRATDYDAQGPDVPLCFLHANEEPSYRAALHIGRAQWRAVEPVGFDGLPVRREDRTATCGMACAAQSSERVAP